MRSARTVPHMQSIWIDQNQYMEKLYGCQMDQLFDATTTVSGTKIIRLDAFDDHETDIHILNSSIPILGSNTNFIDLSASHRLIPQPKNPARKGSTPVKTPIIQWDKIRRVAKECQKFITNPKVKLGNKKGKHSKTVSKPYAFHHISHAETCVDYTERDRSSFSTLRESRYPQQEILLPYESHGLTLDPDKFAPHTPPPLCRAFCTPKLELDTVSASASLFELDRSPQTLVRSRFTDDSY